MISPVQFGRNFKVVWNGDPHRGESDEETEKLVGDDAQMRNIRRGRRLAMDLQKYLRRMFIQVQQMSLQEQLKYDTMRVTDEHFYPTILTGTDAYLAEAIGRVIQNLSDRKKIPSDVQGILRAMGDPEREAVIEGLERAQTTLVKPNGPHRIDIMI